MKHHFPLVGAFKIVAGWWRHQPGRPVVGGVSILSTPPLFLRYVILLNFAVFFCQNGFTQYFYHDIVLTMQNRQQQQLYKKNNISLVQLTSYEANGQPTADFACEVTLNKDYTQTKTFTASPISGSSLLTTFFDAGGLPYRSTDSSAEVVNEYEYKYNPSGRLSEARSISGDPSGKTKEVEVHLWQYDQVGCAKSMYRVKNGTDTTFVEFVCDEQGNVIEEQSRWRQIAKEKIYYYYDSSDRLTDIVRYNTRAGRLLPDYMFEYDAMGQLIQMTVMQQGENDYLIWKYQYEENGLRKSATCLNKLKKPVGRITYQYKTQPVQQ